jgi:hypothetical protein
MLEHVARTIDYQQPALIAPRYRVSSNQMSWKSVIER